MSLYVQQRLTGHAAGADIAYRNASPADLLAAVRAAVEDGTIEGSAINVHRLQADSALDAPLLQAPEPGTYIVIGPVSDGGSET
jgi:hypothetical protein